MLRWSRVRRTMADILLRQCQLELLAPVSSALLGAAPSDRVHVIPMLHVGSTTFYDTVLRYIAALAAKNGVVNRQTFVLVEGVVEDEAARTDQAKEYAAVQSDPTLNAHVVDAAKNNTLYSLDVQQEMCSEIHLPWDVVSKFLPLPQRSGSGEERRGELRLQDCYFKPLIATMQRIQVRNPDVTHKELIDLYWETAGGPCGNPFATGTTLGELGRLPLVKLARERRCADEVRRLVAAAAAPHQDNGDTSLTTDSTRHPVGERGVDVVVPWGYYHADGIVQALIATHDEPQTSIEADSAPIEFRRVQSNSKQNWNYGLPTELSSQL